MNFRKISALALSAALAATFTATASAEDTPEYKGAVILHTNDVHCGINADENTFGYADLAAYETKLLNEGYDVLIADAGDFAQGDVIGTLSDGEFIVDIMNEVGYDIAVPGNHEFDYGMEQFFNLVESADFSVLSCNFVSVDGDSKQSILVPAAYLEISGYSVGLVGICTPQTLTSTAPSNFMDENGNFIYDFCSENNGEELYERVQKTVDAVNEQYSPDYFIAIAHLGIEGETNPWTSYRLIENTTGIDVVIDGHSHSVIDGEEVKNKDGETVLLTSCGTKMQYIGAVSIDENGISTELISKDEYTVTTDEESEEYKTYSFIKEYIGGIEAEYADIINTVVATTDVKLTTTHPDDPSVRIIRNRETNLGNLCADACRIMMGADCAMTNGGGVRADIEAGEITYGDIIAVHPFGNEICLVEATGQEILDALEIGAYLMPEENGSFFHVSGITYEIHTYIPSPVKFNDSWMVTGIEGERRVKNVTIGGEPVDPEKIYTMASHNYLIKQGGCECSMFMDNKLLADSVILDNRILIDYITEKLGGVIGEEYADPFGDGRISILAEAPEDETPEDETPEEDENDSENPDTGVGPISSIVVIAGAVMLVSRRRR